MWTSGLRGREVFGWSLTSLVPPLLDLTHQLLCSDHISSERSEGERRQGEKVGRGVKGKGEEVERVRE